MIVKNGERAVRKLTLQYLDQYFEFFDEFLLHFRAFVYFLAGFPPVRGAPSHAGLFAYVLVDDVVNFLLVRVRNCHIGFF